MLYIVLCTYLIITILRPQDFLGSLKGTPLVFIVMSILGIMWLFSGLDKKIKTTIDKCLVAFFIVMIVSGALTLYPTYFINNTVEVFKVALVYGCMATIIDDERKFVSSLWLLTMLISIVSLMAILQQHGTDITGIGMFWSSEKEVWQIRGVGIFDNPNDLAYSMLPAMAVSFTTLLFDKRSLVRSCALLIVLLLSYCVFLTNSRGGFLAHLTLLIVVCNYAITNVTFKKVVLILSLCSLVVVFATKSQNYRSDESAMGRVEAWSAGMSMLSSNPLFGVGKGNFIDHHSRDSHSTYVRAGAELGFLGLYVFISILYWSIKSLNIIITCDKLERFRVYAVSLVAYLFSFMVGSIFSTRTYDILLVIMAAFISILIRIAVSDREEVFRDTFVVENFWNVNIFSITVATIIIWKIFLIQTW